MLIALINCQAMGIDEKMSIVKLNGITEDCTMLLVREVTRPSSLL